MEIVLENSEQKKEILSFENEKERNKMTQFKLNY